MAFDDLMARVKNPTVNKQAKEIQSAIAQHSAGKIFRFAHLNAAKLVVSNVSHSDVIYAHSFR